MFFPFWVFLLKPSKLIALFERDTKVLSTCTEFHPSIWIVTAALWVQGTSEHGDQYDISAHTCFFPISAAFEFAG